MDEITPDTPNHTPVASPITDVSNAASEATPAAAQVGPGAVIPLVIPATVAGLATPPSGEVHHVDGHLQETHTERHDPVEPVGRATMELFLSSTDASWMPLGIDGNDVVRFRHQRYGAQARVAMSSGVFTAGPTEDSTSGFFRKV